MLMVDMQPGETITPGGSEPAQQSPPEGPEQTGPQTQWQYSGDTAAEASEHASVQDNQAAVSWTASEFIAHEKAAGWYLLLAVATVALAAIVYFLTKDKITAGMVIFVAIMFGVVAARKPRVLDYEVGAAGVRIGSKLYPYQLLKSFSIVQEGAVSSVVLMPLRRFMPSLTLYYPPDQEEAVLDTLGGYLPQEERSSDPIDRLMRKVRF